MTSAIRLKLYFQLSRNSQLSITRRKKGWGRPHDYRPQARLIARLAKENNTTTSAITRELARERRVILDNPGALIYQDFS